MKLPIQNRKKLKKPKMHLYCETAHLVVLYDTQGRQNP